MNFYKDTIIGQALIQVQSNNANEKYLEDIDVLVEDINELAYMNTDTKPWNKDGVIVTDKILTEKEKDPSKIYVETADVTECSWMIERLVEIYRPPKEKDYNRLVIAIGYLLGVYYERGKLLSDILKLTAVTSTIYLHPDHIEKDVFTVYPNKFPPFGDEF